MPADNAYIPMGVPGLESRLCSRFQSLPPCALWAAAGVGPRGWVPATQAGDPSEAKLRPDPALSVAGTWGKAADGNRLSLPLKRKAKQNKSSNNFMVFKCLKSFTN